MHRPGGSPGRSKFLVAGLSPSSLSPTASRSRTAVKEVSDHLGGNFLGISADTLGNDAVIGRHDEHGSRLCLRLERFLNGTELATHFKEPTESTCRHRQSSLVLSGAAKPIGF